MPGHALKTRPNKSLPAQVAALPSDWLELNSRRAREVVAMCIQAMHDRLNDPDALAAVPLRDLAQAAQRTQLTAALLSGEAWNRNQRPPTSRANDDAAAYLDAVTVDGASDSVCKSKPSLARVCVSGADPTPSSEPDMAAASAESVELT
jgi:hypothetical protein